MPLIAELVSRDYTEIFGQIENGGAADIGCADGDVAMLFAHLGVQVDAIDHSPNNYNMLAGAEHLLESLEVPVKIHDLDLDGRFEFPGSCYQLALLLGTLYHLKNPYYLLEHLAYRARWCILSTRIAQLTPRVGARIESEPLAYLADGREINNDATNYWIFSATGLLRLVQRTRWAVRSVKRVGCAVDSNPIAADLDERMFMLLKSRVYDPGLWVRPSFGWYPREEGSWCWTAKVFGIDVVLPLERRCSSFSFSVYIPEPVVQNGTNVTITCYIRDQQCGSATCSRPGPLTLSGVLPPSASHDPALNLQFTVASNFGGDGRDLGLCVQVLDSNESSLPTLPFSVQ